MADDLTEWRFSVPLKRYRVTCAKGDEFYNASLLAPSAEDAAGSVLAMLERHEMAEMVERASSAKALVEELVRLECEGMWWKLKRVEEIDGQNPYRL